MGQKLMPWERDNLDWIKWVDSYRKHHDGALPPLPGLEKLGAKYDANPERFAVWHPHEATWFEPVMTMPAPPAPPVSMIPPSLPSPPPVQPCPDVSCPTPPPACSGGTVPEPSTVMLLSIGVILALVVRRFWL